MVADQEIGSKAARAGITLHEEQNWVASAVSGRGRTEGLMKNGHPVIQENFRLKRTFLGDDSDRLGGRVFERSVGLKPDLR